TNVRIPRAAGVDRSASGARLPRRAGPLVRRARQFQPGREGTDHLSRDRVRQDRYAPGPQHHDRDDGEDRRRGESAARRVQVSVQEVGKKTMAKISVVNRDQKRRLLVTKQSKKRAELLGIMGNFKG